MKEKFSEECELVGHILFASVPLLGEHKRAVNSARGSGVKDNGRSFPENFPESQHRVLAPEGTPTDPPQGGPGRSLKPSAGIACCGANMGRTKNKN